MELKHGLYIILCAALTYPLSLQAHAQQTCTPDYQVEYTPCKQTDKIVNYETQKSTLRLENGKHQCDPNDQALCEAARGSLVSGLGPSDVKILAAYDQGVVDARMCGDMWHYHTRVDVYCAFEYQKPVYEKVPDASCPVASVSDAANCFNDNKQTVNISADVASNCLSMPIHTETELWTKSKCLIDIYNAANDFKLPDLTAEQYKRVQAQLTILRSRPSTPPALVNLFQTENIK